MVNFFNGMDYFLKLKESIRNSDAPRLYLDSLGPGKTLPPPSILKLPGRKPIVYVSSESSLEMKWVNDILGYGLASKDLKDVEIRQTPRVRSVSGFYSSPLDCNLPRRYLNRSSKISNILSMVVFEYPTYLHNLDVERVYMGNSEPHYTLYNEHYCKMITEQEHDVVIQNRLENEKKLLLRGNKQWKQR